MAHKSRKVIQRTFANRGDRARWERVLDEHFAMAEAAFLCGADSLTMLEALPAWLNSMEDAEITEVHIRKCERLIKWFAAALGNKESKDATFGQIRRADLEQIRHDRRQYAAPSTVNGEVGILKTFGRWCIDHELWNATPEAVSWLRIKPLGMKARKPVKLSPEALAQVLNVLPLHVACPLLFLYLAGDRPSACIYSLLWGDVDAPTGQGARGNVSLRKTKTGYRDIAFVGGDDMDRCLDAARAIYERIRGRSPRSYDHVFVTWRTGSAWTGSCFDRALKYHLQRSGMLDLHPYVWRHSTATHAAQQGISTHLIASHTGHKKPSTTERYVHLSGNEGEEVRMRIGAGIRDLAYILQQEPGALYEGLPLRVRRRCDA